MSIQLLKAKILKNQVYVPNRILLPLIDALDGIGFGEVSAIDAMDTNQGSTITFWNASDESIQFEGNIDNPSMYFDCDDVVGDYIKTKLRGIVNKVNEDLNGVQVVIQNVNHMKVLSNIQMEIK